MPIYDFKCPACGAIKRDEFTRSWKEVVRCGCGKEMMKIPSIAVPSIFPSEGIFLEHVSPEGKRFFSKQEMKDYAREHNLEIGYLE